VDDDDDDKAVGVALVGSGRMGAFHAATLARWIPGTQLVAVADPAPGAAARLAANLGAPRACTDPTEVLADPAVDAVVIAAPARFHADLVVAAAGAGKAVFCEKPMALSAADADRAIDAARTAGVVLQVPASTTGGSRSDRARPRPRRCGWPRCAPSTGSPSWAGGPGGCSPWRT
jgi:myo-inositol 2-dehydrogenase/D-chiro-inositol 1-dehydrogenase